MSRESDNEAFVKEFQRRAGIKVDGWAGRKEAWPALDRLVPDVKHNYALKDPTAFFAVVRKELGSLSQSQVVGFNTLLAAMSGWGHRWVAYGLATAWHETNATMQPVREAYWLSEEWRKKNLRYYPWYGRGYPQTTWKENYQNADDELGLGGSLMANPDRMLEPEIAAATMVRGMEEGWFTGKKLSDFATYKDMRQIINGKDKEVKIAGYANTFERALLAGGWA